MKTIVCYGDSNTWGAVPMTALTDVRRFGFGERWTDVLRQELGAGYWMIEEGLNGRTTVWDDPIEGVHKNGKAVLPAILESHQPIDLVVLMLGTNDLKKRFAVSAFDIAASAGTLVDLIQRSPFGVNGAAPQVLLMAPPPVAAKMPYYFEEMFEGSLEKSKKFARFYAEYARQYHCAFLNVGDHIQSSQVDGIHFDLADHQALGKLAAPKVKEVLG